MDETTDSTPAPVAPAPVAPAPYAQQGTTPEQDSLTFAELLAGIGYALGVGKESNTLASTLDAIELHLGDLVTAQQRAATALESLAQIAEHSKAGG